MLFSLEKSNNPYQSIIQSGLFFAAVTLSVLFIFQPFGTYSSQIPYKYVKLFGYGLVTFCAFVLAGLIELKLAKKKRFTPYRRWLIPTVYLTTAAIFNHGYFAISVLGVWHWQNQMLFFLIVSAIALFPILFIYLVNRHANQLNPPETSGLATALEQGNKDKPVQPVIIELIGDNKNEQLTVCLSRLVLVKAADNYCEIVQQHESNTNKTLLRTSLNNLLTQFPKNANVHRCHRSYAVNLDLVESYSGNSGGLTLTTVVPDLVIPVSRGYVKAIKAALSVTP